ncbi:MAG: hypothetical protein AAB784_01140 [Patescibacteria group bacterium]
MSESSSKLKYASVLLVILVVFLFIFIKYEFYGSSGDIDATKFPNEFILSSSKKLSAYEVKDTSDYRLFNGETLGGGASYEFSKPLTETVSEIYREAQANGWLTIAGSGQDQDKTFFKLAKDQQRIFVTVKKITNNRSQVIIVPVI